MKISTCNPILLALLFFSNVAAGQSTYPSDSLPGPYKKVIETNPRLYRHQDTTWIYSGICKPLKTAVFTGYKSNFLADSLAAIAHRSRLLTVHGNVQYDFLYRSFADTPYCQKDFRQHTLQSSLTVTVKDKYPLRVNFLVRQSNSPWFRNFFDMGLQFDRQSFERNLRQQLASRIERTLLQRPDLGEAEELLKEQLSRYALLKRQFQSPDLAQYIIEEREKAWYRMQGGANGREGVSIQ